MARGDLDFLKSSFNKLVAELHLVGEPQGPRSAKTCLRAASSVSTISACSTAARRCPTGGHLEQADGTAWMALFTQNMLELAAMELAAHDPHLRGHGRQVRRALPLHRRRHEPARAGRHAGTRTTPGFYYDLATVGYGDVTPATPIAGTLAWLEAVTGQLYLAITVARLVALSLAEGRGSDTAAKGAERP